MHGFTEGHFDPMAARSQGSTKGNIGQMIAVGSRAGNNNSCHKLSSQSRDE
ncbi:hypothetical protein [Limnothrix sp. FACHB-881]|uniref:hypothetical protein n=1 Tax=Limnothrix sp. FACHB-881 TaxID=2692819 RepID=UPI00351C9F33